MKNLKAPCGTAGAATDNGNKVFLNCLWGLYWNNAFTLLYKKGTTKNQFFLLNAAIDTVESSYGSDKDVTVLVVALKGNSRWVDEFIDNR